jgi:hypothetical protein
MSYLVKAIQKLHPEAEFSLQNDDYSTIVWDKLDGQAPSKKDVEDAIAAIKSDEANAEINAAKAKQALLDRLGISEEEVKLLLA